MDVSKTSNPFILLAEGFIRQGNDMEDVARNLAQATLAVMCDGLGVNWHEHKKGLLVEFARFIEGTEPIDPVILRNEGMAAIKRSATP